MATYSNRMGLVKPAGSEPRSNSSIVTNADLTDKFMPCILVNDGVTPPTGDLYDGALVKEKTSGIIWEARKNGGGTFDKVYVRYPFHIEAYRATGGAIAAGSTTAHTAWGELNGVTSAACKNASAANLSGGRFVVPIKGLWFIRLVHIWQANSAGDRALALSYNGSTITGEWEQLQRPNNSFQHKIALENTSIFNAGDTIGAAGWQNSGGALNIDESILRAVLIEPIQ